jgi:hypothetical protein
VADRFGIRMETLGEALVLSATGFDHRLFNRITGIDQAESALAQAFLTYPPAGLERWMLQLLPHRESEAFAEVATELGLVRLRGWAKHVGKATLRVPFRTDLRIERIAGEGRGVLADTPTGQSLTRRAQAWGRIVTQTYGFPEGFAPWFAALGGRPGWHLYLVYHDIRPVAGAALYLPLPPRDAASPPGGTPILANLVFAGTLPAFRSRGAQSALVARRFEDAQALGAHWVVTESGTPIPGRRGTGHRNLVRLGLPVQYVRTNWGPPGPPAAP